MKRTILLLISTFFFSIAHSAEKKIEIKEKITSINLKGDQYRFTIENYAAFYHANKKFLPCLQKALEKNQVAELSVEAYSLNVVECKTK